jgi:hypothetical protein
MQRLTLILSDLYLPQEVSGATVATPLVLPGLSALLRVASVEALTNWRHWLASELGPSGLAEVPVAQVAGRAFVRAEEAGTAWLATPVHLSARLDHVRLVDRGLLSLTAEERVALCDEFARQFGPEYRLHAGAGRQLLLTGISAISAPTVDPARMLDADVATALPRGKEADELRRLGAEIEMWLHASELNAARERARAPGISALWLWGGGPVTPVPAATRATGAVSLRGGDSFLAGLAHFANAGTPLAAPERYAALDAGDAHQVVELAPMSGAPQESLPSLDEHWFVPAREALAAGTLSSLDVVANDTCFRITSRMSWRFWRPRRSWFENVARRPEARRA